MTSESLDSASWVPADSEACSANSGCWVDWEYSVHSVSWEDSGYLDLDCSAAVNPECDRTRSVLSPGYASGTLPRTDLGPQSLRSTQFF